MNAKEWVDWMGFDEDRVEFHLDGSMSFLCDTVIYKAEEKLPVKIRKVFGDFTIGGNATRINTLENFPNEVTGCMDGSNLTEITSLKFVPRKMDSCYFFYRPIIPAYEFRYILLADCHAVDILGQDGISAMIDEILNEGRENGIISSELIPGKIAQLRALK